MFTQIGCTSRKISHMLSLLCCILHTSDVKYGVSKWFYPYTNPIPLKICNLYVIILHMHVDIIILYVDIVFLHVIIINITCRGGGQKYATLPILPIKNEISKLYYKWHKITTAIWTILKLIKISWPLMIHFWIVLMDELQQLMIQS